MRRYSFRFLYPELASATVRKEELKFNVQYELMPNKKSGSDFFLGFSVSLGFQKDITCYVSFNLNVPKYMLTVQFGGKLSH